MIKLGASIFAISSIYLASIASADIFRGEHVTQLNIENKTYIIYHDEGGDTKYFRNMAKVLSHHNIKVIIDGSCNSACTLLLQTQYNLNICATSNATLHFHMPFFLSGETGRMLRARHYKERSVNEWKQEWLGAFNPLLNSILQTATDLNLIPNPTITGDTSSMFSINAQLVLPICKER